MPAVRFDLVPGVSRVSIEARSSVHPIVVETGHVTGHVDATVRSTLALHAGELEVEVAELRSGNTLVDRETRRRLDLTRHPSIRAELTSVQRSGADGRFACDGAVAFHGRSREVTGELYVEPVTDGEIVVEGTQTFDVRRWGVTPPRLLVLKVDPEVRVRVHLVARAAG